MRKYFALIIMLCIGFAFFLNAANKDHDPRTKCGLNGYVYNSQGQGAGNQFRKIVVRYSTGTVDTTAYEYTSGNSWFLINCETGLQSGTFRAYAHIVENGVSKYSDWSPSYTWQPHWDLGSYNFQCTRSTPPPPKDTGN